MKTQLPMIILYVNDQNRSKQFYQDLLDQSPVLDVPGMTEFLLYESLMLGLMPNAGIAKIICPVMPDPSTGNGIPRCELYLMVDDPIKKLNKAVAAGAKLISPVSARNWGDEVGYCSDPDGHVIAFAR